MGGHENVSDGDDVSTPILIRRLAKALQRPARLIPFPTSLMHLAGKMLGKTNAVDRLVGSLTLDNSKLKRMRGQIFNVDNWHSSKGGKTRRRLGVAGLLPGCCRVGPDQLTNIVEE
jgi:hypothetical protein